MKRLVLILLALVMLFPPVRASAESKVYAKDTIVKVYASANTGTKLLGRMGFGTSFTLVATSGAWARIRNAAGAIGYCKVSELTSKNPNTDMRKVYVASESAKIYSYPDNTAAAVKTLYQNDSAVLLCISQDNKWCRINKDGSIFYMKKSDLSLTKTETAQTQTVYAASLFLNAYASPNESSKFLGRLPLGTPLTLLGADGSWAYVRNASGTKGYCRIGEITAVNPAGSVQIRYAVTDSVKAYQNPDTGAKTVKTFSANESAEIVIQKDGWGAIRSGSGYIYVRLEQFGENAFAGAQLVYVTAYNMKAYAKASEGSKYLGSLPFGTSLTLIEQSGDWAYVENSQGTKGYCRVSDISWTNPNGEEKAYYAQSGGVCVYQTPSLSAKKVKTCALNEKISVVAETADGKWLRVKLSNGYGYASGAEFSSNETVFTEYVYVKGYSAKAFARADESSKLLGVLPFAVQLTRLSETGVWTMVKNSAGNVGYMPTEELTGADPNTLNETLYAAHDGIRIYTAVSESAGKLQTLSQNDSVTVLAKTEDGKWMRVKASKGFGYAKADDFNTEAIEKETPVYIAVSKLNVYESTDEKSKIIGNVGYGTQLTALGDKLPDNWAKVRNDENGRIGFVKTSGLVSVNNNTHNAEYYAQTNVKGYVLPDTASAVSIVFPMNGKVKVTAVLPGNAWARVSSGEVFAYVETANLGKTKVTEETAGYTDPYRGTASAKIEKVIALAVQQYGKPYIYATEGPDSFDCSGLTLYCFKLGAGINLHRSAQKQGYDTRYAKIENTESLKRGDIICMNTVSDSDLSDHVGIYLGGGQFIHASSGGEKVMVSSITTGYYKRVFSWALRVLP